MRITLYFILTLFILSCSFISVNVEPIAATITKLSACNENGELTEVFAPDEERIFVCGHIQTLEPVDIDINWYYEDEMVFQQFGKDMNGDFYNFIQPGNIKTFPQGNYRIDVLIGGVVAESAKFRVE